MFRSHPERCALGSSLSASAFERSRALARIQRRLPKPLVYGNDPDELSQLRILSSHYMLAVGSILVVLLLVFDINSAVRLENQENEKGPRVVGNALLSQFVLTDKLDVVFSMVPQEIETSSLS